MTERKYEMMKEQVISKVYWGETDAEVLRWLNQKHNIVGDEADSLLRDAHSSKRKDVRKRAIMYLIISGVGVLVSGIYYAAQFFGNFIIVGWVTIAAALMSISCLGVFLKSIFELVTGHRPGSVGDH